MSHDNKITFHTFTELVAKRAGVSRVEADEYIHQLAKTMSEELEKGDYIHLYHFGRLHTTHVGEKRGHNPNSGEPLTIPEHTRVHFRPYRALRFAVNAPFRQLRIKELTEDKTEWRVRTNILILLAIFLVLLILIGIGIKSWILTPDISMVALEKASANVKVVRPVDKVPVTSEPATVASAPEKAQTISAPAVVANVSAKPSVIGVSQGDTLWAISEIIMGDARWWPVIYAENRPELSHHNPDLIYAGITLRIPVLEGNVKSPTSADLRLKTKAYKIVAEDYKKHHNPRAAEYKRAAARGFNKKSNR